MDADFEVFYASMVRPMISWTRPLIAPGGPTSAEDLVQEAFTSAWRNWQLVRTLHEGQRIEWMRTTLVRLSANVWKRDARSRKLLPVLAEQLAQKNTTDPQDAALAAVTAADCLKAMASMKPIERHVSVLCWVLGYSGAEVARLLDENEATIRGAKKRARDKLLRNVDCGAHWPYGARLWREGQPDEV